MKVSLQWAADYVTLPATVTPEQIAYTLTMATVEVEHVADLAAPFAQVVVARVTSVERHPESAGLILASCDAGAGKTVTVVSGGTNIRTGQLVALALPGAKVRARGNDALVLVGEREVRGVHSSGMICGAAELALEHLLPSAGETAVLDLSELAIAPGTGLAKAIGFDDFILEIDNKSLTNRPDLLGHCGIARELSAIYDCPFAALPRFTPPPDNGGLAVAIEDPSRCRRYTATRIAGLSVSQSPFWMRSRLARIGQRPINLPVDLTNYVMLALGQPSHVFDTAQLLGAIHVRLARPREEMQLLDGRVVNLDESTLVIADERRAVALAGAMGGMHSSIADDTGEVLLEMANFEASGVRRAATRLGVRTESSMRFEKALDPALIDDALGLFFATLERAQPAARATAFVDAYPAPITPPAIVTSVRFINRRLGAELPPGEMRRLLERLGFVVSVSTDDDLSVAVPSWRATGDVSLPEDLVEEVGRLYGYENLKFVAPAVKLERSIRQPELSLERRLRSFLAGPCAMQEIVSYPWVEDRYLKAAGVVAALGLATPPAPDVGGLQSSLVPQMLAAVASNLRFFPGFRLFEVARVFPGTDLVRLHPGSELLPRQPKHLAAALVGTDAAALFLEAKGLLESLGRQAQMEPLGFASQGPFVEWAEAGGQLTLTVGARVAGQVGVVTARAARLAGIRRASVALFTLDLSLLRPNSSRQNQFEPIPTHPQKDYDLSLLVPVDVRWVDLHRTLTTAHGLVRNVRLVEEYRGEQVPEHWKSILIQVRMGAADRTLKAHEVDEAAAALVRRAAKEFAAELRGKTAGT